MERFDKESDLHRLSVSANGVKSVDSQAYMLLAEKQNLDSLEHKISARSERLRLISRAPPSMDAVGACWHFA